MSSSQMTQILKFKHAQYIENQGKKEIHLAPRTLCPLPNEDMWPHLLSKCETQHLKGMRITPYNKVVPLITQTSQANKHTRFYTLTNTKTYNNQPPNPTILN